jgi:hypothetical protein
MRRSTVLSLPLQLVFPGFTTMLLDHNNDVSNLSQASSQGKLTERYIKVYNACNIKSS